MGYHIRFDRNSGRNIRPDICQISGFGSAEIRLEFGRTFGRSSATVKLSQWIRGADWHPEMTDIAETRRDKCRSTPRWWRHCSPISSLSRVSVRLCGNNSSTLQCKIVDDRAHAYDTSRKFCDVYNYDLTSIRQQFDRPITITLWPYGAKEILLLGAYYFFGPPAQSL